MGFGKYKNANQAELLHRIDLFDFGTGDPAVLPDGRRQHITILGEKSRAYQNAVERESAQRKNKQGADAAFTFEESSKVLARRLAEVTVSALVDISDTDEPELIEFANINELSPKDREIALGDMRKLFTSITDLALKVNEEVTRSANFLPGRGLPLSSLSSSVSGTTPSSMEKSESEPVAANIAG